MVDRSLILSRLDEIRRSVDRLARFAQLTESEFWQDPDHFAVAEHHLRRALEAALDAGRHIIAKEGWGRPITATCSIHWALGGCCRQTLLGAFGGWPDVAIGLCTCMPK